MALRRPYVFDETTYIPAPVGGWNPDGNPWELPANQAPILDNALVRPGRVVVRGALINWADLSAITTPVPPLNVGGVQPLPGSTKLAIGRKAVSSTAYVDPWFAPIVRPAAAATLAAPTANMAVSSGGTTLSNAATAANLIPGPRGISFEGTRYYLSYGAATSGVADAGGTFFASPVALCTINSAGTPTALTNAPRGGLDIKGYQSRIWMLGGIDDPAAGTTFNPLRLLFTNPIGPGGGNAASYADWKDPGTGVTNQILMDGDTTDPGVGLATVRNGLLIFRASSIWILRGSTSATYTLQPVTRQVGCVDPRSIMETDNGVYFMSRQGLMLTDGVVVRNVSGAALNTLQQAVSLVSGSIKSSFGGYITGAVTSGGHIVISMGIAAVTSSAPDGHLQPIWCGMFDPAQNVWIRITSPLFTADGTIVTSGNNYPGWVFNTPDLRMLSIGDKYITQWESEFASTTATPSTAADPPGTVANNSAVGGTQAWTSPSNAAVTDGAFASSAIAAGVGFQSSFTLSGTYANDASVGTIPFSNLGSNVWAAGPVANGQTTEYLTYTNLGFSLPANAVIWRIDVTIGVHSNAVGSLAVNAVKLVKGGVVVGTDEKTSNGQSVVDNGGNKTWGGNAGTWGVSLTAADVNASNFGIAVSGTGPGPVGGDTFKLDFNVFSMSVYYYVPTQYLQATNFGFAIPAAATITGIQVSSLRKSAGTSADLEVKLMKAGVVQPTDKSGFVVPPTLFWSNPGLRTDSFGGSSDLWGNTWTPSDINNSGFGVVFSAGMTGFGASNEVDVDSITITVYYTLTNATSQQSFTKQPALYDKDAAGNFQPIPFRWRTQLYPIVGTSTGQRKVGQLKRFFADYVFQGLGLPSANGFTVKPVDDTGTQLPGSTTVQLAPLNNSMSSSSVSGGPPIPSTQIERFMAELNSEATDMAMDITWADAQQSSQPSAVAAELYGIGIDILPGRPLHDLS